MGRPMGRPQDRLMGSMSSDEGFPWVIEHADKRSMGHPRDVCHDIGMSQETA